MSRVALNQSKSVPKISRNAEPRTNLLLSFWPLRNRATTETIKENSMTRSSASRSPFNRLLLEMISTVPNVVSKVSIVAAAVATAAAIRL